MSMSSAWGVALCALFLFVATGCSNDPKPDNVKSKDGGNVGTAAETKSELRAPASVPLRPASAIAGKWWTADVQCKSGAWNSIGTATIVRLSSDASGETGVAVTAGHVASVSDCDERRLVGGADECVLNVIKSEYDKQATLYPYDLAAIRFQNANSCGIAQAKFVFSNEAGFRKPLMVPKRSGADLNFKALDSDPVEPVDRKLSGTDFIIRFSEEDSVLKFAPRYSGSPVFDADQHVVGLVTDRVPRQSDNDPYSSSFAIVQRLSDVMMVPASMRKGTLKIVPLDVSGKKLNSDVLDCRPVPAIAKKFTSTLDAFDQLYIAQASSEVIRKCGQQYFERLKNAIVKEQIIDIFDIVNSNIGEDISRDCTPFTPDEREKKISELYSRAVAQLFSKSQDNGKYFSNLLLDRAHCQVRAGSTPIQIIQNFRLLLIYGERVGLPLPPRDSVRLYADLIKASNVLNPDFRRAAAAFQLYEICFAYPDCDIDLSGLSEAAGELQNPIYTTESKIASYAPKRKEKGQTAKFIKWLCDRLERARSTPRPEHWEEIYARDPDDGVIIDSINYNMELLLGSPDMKSYSKRCKWQRS